MTEALAGLERAFVGGVVLNPASTDTLDVEVPMSALADQRLASVYAAALAVYRRDAATSGDVAAVVAELAARGDLDRVGGAVAIADLVAEACVPGALGWHASRILDARRMRTLEAAAVRIQQATSHSPTPTSSEDADQIIRMAWDEVEAATASASIRTVLPMASVFDRWQNRTESTHVPIGFDLFTSITGLAGVHHGHMVLVAARPATGKSTVLAQAAVAASSAGVGVLFVTLEMVGEEVLERCMANAMATSVKSLRADGVAALPATLHHIQVMDTATAVVDIVAAIRQSRRTAHPIELVLIDYLQLLTPPSRSSENRQTEVAAISRALKRLAVDERVGVLAASQLNRASEARADKRPTLADLRESGQLEADADVVVLLHRDPDEPFEIEFIIAKNRHGAIGSFAAEPDFARSLILETKGSVSSAV